MRRTREWIRPVLILLVGAAALGAGGFFYYKYRIQQQYGASLSGLKEQPKIQRLLSSEPVPSEDKKVAVSLQVALKPNSKPNAKKESDAQEDLDEDSSDSPEQPISDRSGLHPQCQSEEKPGDGFQHSQVSQTDWNLVLKQVDEVKRRIRLWMTRAQGQISETVLKQMENQLKTLRLVRPPSLEEPDLSWRGIGVWARNEAGVNELRLSRGFVSRLKTDSKRGLFELTRLILQSVGPCELARLGEESPWKPLLVCLEVSDSHGCSAGTVSEEGWAVSTSLAQMLSPPDCTLPIFETAPKQKCLQSGIPGWSAAGTEAKK
jgi:hypothetical protein